MELDEKGKLFIFDEPTTGLHPSDVEKLMTVFKQLVSQYNTVIIIEHNLDVIAQADWIIEIGPGAGMNGGELVFEGTVKELLSDSKTKTGVHLTSYLQNKKQ
jgi:excinuclease UvrABC ATPase subunit